MNQPQFSVRLPQSGHDAIHHSHILATLPKRYHRATESADILLLSGRDGNIDDVIAKLRPGVKAVFLTSATFLTQSQLDHLEDCAASAGIEIVIGLQAAPQTRAGLLPRISIEEISKLKFLDMIGHTPRVCKNELREMLFEQLQLAAVAIEPIEKLITVQFTLSHYVVAGSLVTSGASVLLSGRCFHGENERVDLFAVSTKTRYEITAHRIPSAYPSSAIISNGMEVKSNVPLYQGGSRASWIELYDFLTSDGHEIISPYPAARELLREVDLILPMEGSHARDASA